MRYEATDNRFTIHRAEGNYRSPVKKLKLILHGFELNSISINGTVTDIHPEINRFFTGLEKYDPIKDPEPAPEETVMAIETLYTQDEIVFQW